MDMLYYKIFFLKIITCTNPISMSNERSNIYLEKVVIDN